jgi:hypothetical protein
MEQYNKVLIRTSLTDDGTQLPRTGTLSNSPDVIPYGITKVADPVEFFLLNYDQNVGAELLATQKNYIYMRGKDVVTGLVKADMYVYYAKDADLNTPKKWVNNLLKTSAGKSFNTVLGQNEGNILVGADAYEWTPPDPLAGETYSLVGVAVPSGTVPSFTGVKNFEDFVANNLNVGWTKVTIKKPTPPPTPNLRWETTFNYDEGAVARDMNFEISCKNIPVGSMVAFRSDNNVGPDPAILLNKTTVNEPNAHIGIESIVPAGYKGNITFSFYCKDTPPTGSAITFRGYYFDTPNSGPQKPIVVTSVTTTN